MTSKLESLLGESVINPRGEKVSVRTLCTKDSVVGLYFSAFWCPPCRTFTPILAKFYQHIKQNKKGINFEIVFISRDRDENGYNDYVKLMPWLALPYEQRDSKTKFTKKYRIQGIPKLILLNGETGETITTDGYRHVVEDENGMEFPWRQKPFLDLINGKILQNVDEKRVEVDASEVLKGKIVGLYFSAHWCPPCRSFTLELIDKYEKVNKRGDKFEIVFCTSDRSEDSFNKYFSTMPWVALPFGDDRLKNVKEIYSVEGIPTLLMFDECGKNITMNGRSALLEDKEGEEFPWYPKPFELTGGAALTLNESACLVLFTEGEDEDIAKAKNVLTDLAIQEHQKGEDQELFVFYGADDEICDTVRDFANLDDRCPLLVILNFPEQEVYISPAAEITKDIATDFVKKFYDGTLEAQPLRPTAS